MGEAESDDTTQDALLGGRVTLLQPRRGHRAGTDAVLLAGLAPVRAGDRIGDFGSASGAVGLMLAARAADLRVVFVERDPALAALCVRNAAANGLADRARVVTTDLFGPKAERRAAGISGVDLDLVVTNPPFFETTARPSPDAGRRAAHVMEGGGLADWLEAAADALAPRGRLAVIHRADSLADVLAGLGRRFGSVLVRAVHPDEARPATRILVSAVKGGRAPLGLLPPLVLHRGGAFTDEAALLHAGEAAPST